MLNALAQARVCAFFHLRLFDDFPPLLHLHADAATFVLVNRMAHAQAAPTARLVFLPSFPGEHQRSEKDQYSRDEFTSHVHGAPLQVALAATLHRVDREDLTFVLRFAPVTKVTEVVCLRRPVGEVGKTSRTDFSAGGHQPRIRSCSPRSACSLQGPSHIQAPRDNRYLSAQPPRTAIDVFLAAPLCEV